MSGSARQARMMSLVDNVEALVLLHHLQKRRAQEERSVKQAADQFILTAAGRPRKQRTKFQWYLHDDPNARRDTEEAEIVRSIHILFALVKDTPTPVGRMLLSQPGAVQLLGAGQDLSTPRSRVRSLWRLRGTRRRTAMADVFRRTGACDGALGARSFFWGGRAIL